MASTADGALLWLHRPVSDTGPRPADLRVHYDLGRLDEADLPPTPLAAFDLWFRAAVDAGLSEPNAMVLATADETGAPSSRTVLLKGVDARGFTLFTNLDSRKGRELAVNPQASITFPWFALHRQVTVIGHAELLPRDEVADYFASRPHGSRLGAWASRQSTVIAGREPLESAYRELSERYPEGSEIPVPDFWGGWLIRPVTIEFWQGRESRLHDRLRFRSRHGQGTPAAAALDDASAWQLERLSP